MSGMKDRVLSYFERLGDIIEVSTGRLGRRKIDAGEAALWEALEARWMGETFANTRAHIAAYGTHLSDLGIRLGDDDFHTEMGFFHWQELFEFGHAVEAWDAEIDLQKAQRERDMVEPSPADQSLFEQPAGYELRESSDGPAPFVQNIEEPGIDR